LKKIFYLISFLLLSYVCITGFLFELIDNSDLNLSPVMSSGAPIPIGLRYPACVGYTRNDSAWVYVFGGLQDGNIISSGCSKYNVKSNTWESIAPLPSGATWIGCAVRLGNNLYNIGGTSGLALNDAKTWVQKYDVNTNTWTTAAPIPYARCFNQAVAFRDSFIYMAGGWGLPGLMTYSEVYIYNKYTDIWRPATSMPNPRCGGVLAISNDTLVYVCGGLNWVNPAATNTVYRGKINPMDYSSITWDTTGAVYPGGVRNSISGASWDGAGIIVSGGYQVSVVTNQCYVYSPGRNQWTQMPNLLAAKTDHGTASVFMGNVWKFVSVTGTNNRSGTNSTTVDILTDTLIVTGIKNIKTIPSTMKLHQNFPNPFNPVTIINFEISSNLSFPSRLDFSENVSVGNPNVVLKVYNIQGREVATLVDKTLTAGSYKTSWDASDFPAGIYFYRLTAGDFSETRKMILLK